ncbi:VP2 [Eubenangee virus]|uniref:Outer capsid protein VP2 n=1 Tax=Eubenangee virus TaxID=40056 RepID=H9ZXR3_9REOV|nr:VP2 [Eubenangee virus]AFH41510.1 VP2 [Eubenangee virus]
MASELTIAVTEKVPEDKKELFDAYDIVIETAKRIETVTCSRADVCERWRITDEVERKAIAVGHKDDVFDTIRNRISEPDEVCVAPSHLRLAMHEYARRERENVDSHRMLDEIDSLDDNQVIRIKDSEIPNKISHDAMFGALHCKTHLAETLAYERYPVPNTRSCVHELAHMTDQLLAQGLYYVFHSPFYHIPTREFYVQDVQKGVSKRADDKIAGTLLGATGKSYAWQPNMKNQPMFLLGVVDGRHNPEKDWFKKVYKILDTVEWKEQLLDQSLDLFRKLSEQCSTIGVEYADEREELDIYYTGAFLKEMTNIAEKQLYNKAHKSAMDQEYKRFAVSSLISATKAYGRKITRFCRYRVLHGAWLYHKAMFIEGYDQLRKDVGWEFDKEMEGGIRRRTESSVDKLRPLKRWNVYGAAFGNTVELGVTWVSSLTGGLVDADAGSPYVKTEVEEGAVNTPLICEVDEQKYSSFVQKLIDDEKWTVTDGFDNMMREGQSLIKMDIEKDVTIDDHGTLMVPDYYDREIVYNFYGDLKLRCHEVATTGKEPKNKADKRLLVFDREFGLSGLIRMGLRPCDFVSLGEGKELSYNFDEQNPILDVLSEEIRESEVAWFGKWYEESFPTAKLEGYCLSSVPTTYLLWSWGRTVFSILKHHAPAKIIERAGEKFAIYPSIDCWNFDDQLMECRTMDQIILRILEYCFEGRHMEDRLTMMRRIRRSVGEERLEIFRRTFPGWYSCLVSDSTDGALALNFLPLLFLEEGNKEIKKDITTIPITFCDANEVRIVPIDVKQTRRTGSSGSWLGWLIRCYGKKNRPKNMDAAQRILKDIAFEYYMSTGFLDEMENYQHLISHRSNYIHWLGERCGGVSEGVSMIRTIVHPKPEFILLVISDAMLEKHERIGAAVIRFRGLDDSNIGVVHVQLNKNDVEVSADNKVRVRLLSRSYRGCNHKLIIVKSAGRVFGNDNVVAKLMNI